MGRDEVQRRAKVEVTGLVRRDGAGLRLVVVVEKDGNGQLDERVVMNGPSRAIRLAFATASSASVSSAGWDHDVLAVSVGDDGADRGVWLPLRDLVA